MDKYSAILYGAVIGAFGSMLYYGFFKLLCRYSSCNAIISKPHRLAFYGMAMGAIIGFFILGR